MTWRRLVEWIHSDAQPPADNPCGVYGVVVAGNGLRFSVTHQGHIWLEDDGGGRPVSLAEAKLLIGE